MVSVAKCMSIMTAGGFAVGAGLNYYTKTKQSKVAAQQLDAIAKDGYIPVGGMTKDGKMWDGKITVDEAKGNLKKATKITSLISGVAAALTTALITGCALLLRGKIR